MKSEIKCGNPECCKVFLAWPSANKRYCSLECARKINMGDNNPMKKQVNKDKISTLLTGRDITWGDEISKSLKTSELAKKQHFKSGKDNPAFGTGDQQKGNLNPNWKGGTTSTNQLLRGGSKYKEFRIACMVRDGYKCTKCGISGYLQVHHIKELAKYPELACDVDNGETVCIPCHKKIHGKEIGKLKRK